MKDYTLGEIRAVNEAYERMVVGESFSNDSVKEEIRNELVKDGGKALEDILVSNGDNISYKVEYRLESVERPGCFLSSDVMDWDLKGCGLEEIVTNDLDEAELFSIDSEMHTLDGFEDEMKFTKDFAESSGFRFSFSGVKWTAVVLGRTYVGSDDSVILNAIVDNFDSLFVRSNVKGRIDKTIDGFHVVDSSRGMVKLNSNLFERLDVYGKSLGVEVECYEGDFKGDNADDEGSLDYISFSSYRSIVVMMQRMASLFCSNVPSYAMETKEEFVNRCCSLAGRKMRTEWYGEDFSLNEDEIICLVNPIAEKSDDGIMTRTSTRFITGQNDSVSFPLSDTVAKDLGCLGRYMKDRYHVGNHWSNNMRGFYDRGEWDDSYSSFIFHGKIPFSSINAERTISARYRFTEEDEIFVSSGKPILKPEIWYCTNQINIHMWSDSKCFIA